MNFFVRILRKRAEARKEYFENYEKYVKEIGRYFRRKLVDVKVFIFGSILTENWDQESDIDVLVVSPNAPDNSFERASIVAEIKLKIGSFNPFEIHLVSPLEFNDWYSVFIKDRIREIEF